MDPAQDLITPPIPRLVARLAVPASLGMFFNTMFNVTDTLFAGMLSTTALAALSLSFPVFFLAIAIGSGLGTGITALIGNALGQGRREEAALLAAQGLVFCALAGLALTAAALGAAPWLFGLLGASGDYLATALSYMRVILAGSTLFILTFALNGLLQARGDTRSFRNFLAAGFVLNIGLDPWFIFGGLGMPALGLAGVAWATLLVEALGVAYLGRQVMKRSILRRCQPRHFLPQGRIFAQIAYQGFPASLNMLTVALGVFVLTYYIKEYGPQAVAAYGAAVRLEQIVLLPTIGLNVAVLTLTAQNNGAGRLDRVRQALSQALFHGAWLMALGGVALFFAGRPLMSLFTSDPLVLAHATAYLKVAAFALYGYVILFSSVSLLQGLKRPLYPIFMGAARQFILPVAVFHPLVFVFGLPLSSVWIGLFFIVWASALVTIFVARRALALAEKKQANVPLA